MKILYCNKYNFRFSGTEAYLFDVMDLMRERGQQAALFSMADPRGEPTQYDQHFVPLIDFKAGGQGLSGQARLASNAIYSRGARSRLQSLIAEFKPDVAHVRNIYHHLSPSILWELKAQSVPVVYHLNDFKLLCPSYNMVARGQTCERCKGGKFWHVLTEGCYSGPRGSRLLLATEAYTHRWLQTYEKCVDCFLAPSEFVKSKLVENGWNARKIEVLSHFQNLPERARAESAPNAPILYFGRLSAEKGVADLLQAMRLLPGLRLKIAGDGPQRGELESLAEQSGLTNTEFVGYVQGRELDALISSARFTVLPSRAYETFGKSILESFSQNRPVVASDLGSRRELVREGETGLLFPVGNVERLASAISYLGEHPQQAAAMGATGREFVRVHHSPENHYLALTRLYERLARPGIEISPPSLPPGAAIPRVAFIGGRGVISKYSGIETYYEEAGRRLAAAGHEVTVYCRTYFTPALEEFSGMRLVRLPTIRSKHLETVVHTFLSTVHAMFHGCDIVHYHALGPALFSFFPRLMGKKTVVTVQGQDWKRKKWGRIASAVLRLGEQASLRLPNATMVVSQTLQQRYHDQYGIATTYVPNGTTLRKRQRLSQIVRWGIEPGNYILYMGRFSPEKNCHLLIEAYQKIETPVKLVLAGGSSHSDAYATELRKHQSAKIRMLDWISGQDLEELLTNAMLLVLPSDLEGLSLALLDAMGARVCVLASDVPENREVVEDVGFTFRPGDVDDLACMLKVLISQPQLRQAAAGRALERVRQRYLWPEIANQIGSTYQSLMGRKKAVTSVSLPTTLSKPASNPTKHAA
jgi:glycosyltransferase involved in cell wall biosynthesis